jgi:hypothetical protein
MARKELPGRLIFFVGNSTVVAAILLDSKPLGTKLLLSIIIIFATIAIDIFVKILKMKIVPAGSERISISEETDPPGDVNSDDPRSASNLISKVRQDFHVVFGDGRRAAFGDENFDFITSQFTATRLGSLVLADDR